MEENKSPLTDLEVLELIEKHNQFLDAYNTSVERSRSIFEMPNLINVVKKMVLRNIDLRYGKKKDVVVSMSPCEGTERYQTVLLPAYIKDNDTFDKTDAEELLWRMNFHIEITPPRKGMVDHSTRYDRYNNLTDYCTILDEDLPLIKEAYNKDLLILLRDGFYGFINDW